MEDDESYSSAMSRILGNARGPLEDIEDFETSEQDTPGPDTLEPDTPEPNTKTNATTPADPTSTTADSLAPTKSTLPATTDRTAILRLAAIMAVLGMSEQAPAKIRQIGRRRGTAWAQDHRFAAMGLPGVAHRITRRSTWR